MTEWKREYKLEFRPLGAPPIIVPSITVEVYLAVGKEQAERLRIRREIEPELPYAHDAYHNVWDLPKEWLVKEGIARNGGSRSTGSKTRWRSCTPTGPTILTCRRWT